ncbi:MAG TPA: Holliday junction branch migration protein RuvA [Longimicrobium sp.]|nr:Holliday junction branch migration protein RuvA [Longimicrobium sp.]
MIAALRGVVLEKNLNDVVVDVNGVGYRVFMSLITLAALPDEGKEVRLRIRTVVREEALDLYGFLNAAEENLFLLLTSVSGIGPKLGMNVLSGLDVQELISAIGKGEVARLTKIHGVGKKTAERIVLELKDKMKALGVTESKVAGEKPSASPPSGVKNDLVSALINLGYKPPQAEKAADSAAERAGAEAPFEVLFREALKGLRTNP